MQFPFIAMGKDDLGQVQIIKDYRSETLKAFCKCVKSVHPFSSSYRTSDCLDFPFSFTRFSHSFSPILALFTLINDRLVFLHSCCHLGGAGLPQFQTQDSLGAPLGVGPGQRTQPARSMMRSKLKKVMIFEERVNEDEGESEDIRQEEKMT